MSLSFCEKYKPRKSADIIGDYHATAEIAAWLKRFPREKFKCMLLTGSHGSGKTCRINTILEELNYTIKQFNILKFKKAEKPELYVREAAACSNIITMFKDQSNQKCAIVIDELDTELLTQEKNQLINLMKLNNVLAICPIIFVFDTKHNKLINTLRKGSYEVRIESPSETDMMELLKRICYSEKIRIKNELTAKRIIDFSQNDFRRLCTTLNDITSDVGNVSLTIDIVNNYENTMLEKDMSVDLFKSTRTLLTHYKTIDDCSRIYEVEKVNIPLMIHQNYLLTLDPDKKKSVSPKILKQLTNALSLGDIIDNYIYGEQRWDITNVHGFYSCCMPSYLLKEQKLYGSPKFFVDMGRTSNKKLNKKHIINAAKIFNSTDPIDYVYMNKLFISLLSSGKFDALTQIMKAYNLTIDNVENVLKIDKNTQHKIALTTKQRKMLQKI